MNSLLPFVRVAGHRLESFGQILVERFAALNVIAAVLLVGALVLDRLLARRVEASWRIALYVPVALRVLVPLDWNMQITHATNVVPLAIPLDAIRAGVPSAEGADAAVNWHVVAGGVYLGVAVLLALRSVFARVRLAQSIAGALPVSTSLLSGVPYPVLQKEDAWPMTVGVVAPKIVIPPRLLAAGEEHALACVLAHEAAHVRRNDAWLALALEVLVITAWPVLPVWIASMRVRQLVELACDEDALAGADPCERRRYGHALLDMAEWQSRGELPLSSVALHFGSTVRARIEALAMQRAWPRAVQAVLLSVAPALLIAACGGAAPAPKVTTTSATDPPPGDSTTSEGYGYEFEPDCVHDGAKAQPKPPSAQAIADGRTAPETIQNVVRSHFPAFEACYKAGLAKDPSLRGTVAVRYVFGADGVIKEAQSEAPATTLPDQDVVWCVVSEFRNLVSFPPRQTGDMGDVTVVYPILFSPE